jgi:hypothetical protein
MKIIDILKDIYKPVDDILVWEVNNGIDERSTTSSDIPPMGENVIVDFNEIN